MRKGTAPQRAEEILAEALLRREQQHDRAPLDPAGAAERLIEDLKKIDDTFSKLRPDEHGRMQRCFWLAQAAVHCFLAERRYRSPTVTSLLDALQNIAVGMAGEKRLEPVSSIGRQQSVKDEWERARAIVSMQRAKRDRAVVAACAAHLAISAEQVMQMVRDFEREKFGSAALRHQVKAVEERVDAGDTSLLIPSR